MTLPPETPVLIVGGGPVGLALALDLNHMGVSCTVIEQDEGTGIELLAKAGTLNERTMEFCRRWGLVNAVAGCFPDDHPRDNVFCTTLDGELIGRTPVPSTLERGVPDGGPEMLRKCAQYLFDPILARAVQDAPLATLHYGQRFEGLIQDGEGVDCSVRDLASGALITVRARYVVACDGTGSAVRKSVGMRFEGLHLDYSLSAMVRIPGLERHHRFGKVERFMFMGAGGTWANMTTVDGESLWRFTVVGSEEALNPERYNMDATLRRAFGHLDVPFEILRVVPWRRSQFLVDTYRVGRVLLAGDAAHTTSPTGGHGLNTGIGDITDLSWMLQALTQGWGGERLLDAYTTERRAVAKRNFSSSTANYKVWVGKGMANVDKTGPEGMAARRNIGAYLNTALYQEWFSQGIALGYSYDDSPLVASDGTPRPHDDPSRYVPTARPGHRAPHAWLTDGRSTLDLFGRGFVLLAFETERTAARLLLDVAQRVGMPLRVECVSQPEIAALYERRWVLVRPDGMVAWRGDELPVDAEALINQVRGA